VEYLALNPHIYSLIPKLIEKINKEDPRKLSKFYHNLALNTNKKVISYLNSVYIKNPDSTNIKWLALCGNPKAIKILEEEYKNNPDSKNLEWPYLCENLKAIEIFKEEYKKNPNKLDWDALCKNPKAIRILIKEYNDTYLYPLISKLVWRSLCNNPKAIKILRKEYNKNHDSEKLYWFEICENPGAIEIINEEYKRIPNKLNWNSLSENQNPEVIDLLKKRVIFEQELLKSNMQSSHSQRINGQKISKNPSPEAIQFLSDNRNYIFYDILSGNTNPDAIKLLDVADVINKTGGRGTYDVINWTILSSNPNAINMIINRLKLEKDEKKKDSNWTPYNHPELNRICGYINLPKLLANPSIFTI
jgi:hypothetical protein